MTIRFINAHLFDIFWGKGWDNWARIQNNKGFLKQTAGIDIPKIVFAQLLNQFNKKEA